MCTCLRVVSLRKSTFLKRLIFSGFFMQLAKMKFCFSYPFIHMIAFKINIWPPLKKVSEGKVIKNISGVTISQRQDSGSYMLHQCGEVTTTAYVQSQWSLSFTHVNFPCRENRSTRKKLRLHFFHVKTVVMLHCEGFSLKVEFVTRQVKATVPSSLCGLKLILG